MRRELGHPPDCTMSAHNDANPNASPSINEPPPCLSDAGCAGNMGGPGNDPAGKGANCYGNVTCALGASIEQMHARDLAAYESCVAFKFKCDSYGHPTGGPGINIWVYCSGSLSTIFCAPPPEAIGMSGGANDLDIHPGLAAFYNNPNCPHRGDIIHQADCTISGPLKDAAGGLVDTAETAAATGALTAQSVGTPITRGALKEVSGSFTELFGILEYTKLMVRIGYNMVAGCK